MAKVLDCTQIKNPRRRSIGTILELCQTCTIRVRRGSEIICPECERWVILTIDGFIPKHKPLKPGGMLDADGRCFGTSHRVHRFWRPFKTRTYGGSIVTMRCDQFGNLDGREHPYSIDNCDLVLAANAKRAEAKAPAGGQSTKKKKAVK